MSSLMTPIEFIQVSPLTKDFPPIDICSIIEIEEESWYDDTELGLAFYEALKADRTAINPLTKEWSQTKVYNLNDTVTFYGTVLKSVSASNTGRNPISDNGTYWEIVPKFQTSCVNDLWKSISLAFSYKVLSLHLVEMTYKISAKGATKYNDDFRQNTSGLSTIERGERYDLQANLDNNANRYYETMLKKLKRSTCPIVGSAKFSENCSTERLPKTSNRRIAYRH